MANKRIIKHSVDWGIIEDATWWLWWSRHLLNISYGKRTAKILMDIWWDNKLSDDKSPWFDPLRKIDVKNLDSVIVSHIHQDHNGDVVHLTKWGYTKEIVMTQTSRQLTDIITRDNLKTQSEEKSVSNKRSKEEWDMIRRAVLTVQMDLGIGKTRNKKSTTRHPMPLKRAMEIVEKHGIQVSKIKNEWDLEKYKPKFRNNEFNEQDIKVMLEHIKVLPYKQEHTVVRDFVKAKFYNAWHIQWSAQTLLKIIGNNKMPKNTFNLLYTWDIGRFKQPWKAWEPEIPTERVDYLIIEWTYGDKLHADRDWEKRRFINQLNNAKWLTLIPGFAVERFQEVREMIWEALANKELRLRHWEKIYFHSNLAYDISKEYLAQDAQGVFKHLHNNRQMEWLTDQTEIQWIMHGKWRRIIVTTGGMMENGSLMQYLHHATQSQNAQILTVWFQAPGTIWQRLSENDFSKPIIVNDKPITSNKAAIHWFSFSSHGDQEELLHYISKLKLAHHVEISIVHWWDQRFALKKKIEDLLKKNDLHKKMNKRWLWQVHVPAKNGTEIIVYEPVNMNQ